MGGIRRTDTKYLQNQFPELVKGFAGVVKDQNSRDAELLRLEDARNKEEQRFSLAQEEAANQAEYRKQSLANQAARIGLDSNKLTYQQKELFDEEMYRRGQGTRYKDHSKNEGGSYATTIPSDVSSNMKANDLTKLRQMERNMFADNASRKDVAAATANETTPISWWNVLNFNDYGLESELL